MAQSGGWNGKARRWTGGPSVFTTFYSLGSAHCCYGLTSELEWEPLATEATQTGWLVVGNGESATPVS